MAQHHGPQTKWRRHGGMDATHAPPPAHQPHSFMFHARLPAHPPPGKPASTHLSPMVAIICRARPSFSATKSWTSNTNCRVGWGVAVWWLAQQSRPQAEVFMLLNHLALLAAPTTPHGSSSSSSGIPQPQQAATGGRSAAAAAAAAAGSRVDRDSTTATTPSTAFQPRARRTQQQQQHLEHDRSEEEGGGKLADEGGGLGAGMGKLRQADRPAAPRRMGTGTSE